MLNPTQKRGAAGSDFEKKLIRYALMGGAALAVPAVSYATPIVTFENTTILGNSSLPVDLDGVLAFTLQTYVSSSEAEVSVTGPGTTQFVGLPPGGPFQAYAGALGGNTLISSSSDFTVATAPTKLSKWESHYLATGYWNPDGEAFLGLQFQVSGVTHYGFALIQINVNDPSASATLIETGYESSANAGITTPAIPEPSTLALFALGAAGILAIKRRRVSR